MKEIPNVHEQMFVSTLLSQTNAKTSALLDTFSGWLTAGFGASAGLLISQYDSISKHLPAQSIKTFLLLFCWALIAGIMEKYLAVGVAASSEGHAVGLDLGSKAAEKSISLDLKFIMEAIKRPIFRPGLWFVSRVISRVDSGDLMTAPMTYTRIAQFQGLLALAQAVLIVVAIFKIAYAFHV